MDSEVNEIILSKKHINANELINGIQYKKVLINSVIF